MPISCRPAFAALTLDIPALPPLRQSHLRMDCQDRPTCCCYCFCHKSLMQSEVILTNQRIPKELPSHRTRGRHHKCPADHTCHRLQIKHQRENDMQFLRFLATILDMLQQMLLLLAARAPLRTSPRETYRCRKPPRTTRVHPPRRVFDVTLPKTAMSDGNEYLSF